MGDNWANWSLVCLGGLMIVVEVVLGAATGLDFALVGISLAAGGGIGLFFESTKVGLFSAGALAFIYLAFFRRWIRSQFTVPDRPSNVDAILGSKAIVTVRIAPNDSGQVKVGHEIWRAVLSTAAKEVREPGDSVLVESVDGATLIVR